jgi:hypothetical protein
VQGGAAAATVFARSGGYDTTATFTSGFVHAMWACAVLAGAGILAALLAGPRRPDAPALTGDRTAAEQAAVLEA